MHKLQELVRLHRMKAPGRKVARLLGISPNTERYWRGVLQQAGLLDGAVDDLPALEVLVAALPPKATPPQQESSVSDHAERIAQLWNAGAGPRAIYDRLRLDHGDALQGSYWAVKRFCARLEQSKPVQPGDVAIPVETAPGEVAQVDFGYAGMFIDPKTGKLRKAWVFVLVLAFSRHMFAKLVFDQRSVTWQQLHVEAIHWFGGVFLVVVPDNLKSAIVCAAFGLGSEPGINRSYAEVARHYGFQIDPTPPFAPQKKGKVERSVQYVVRNAISTMPEGLDIDAANRELARWTIEIAGTRLHGTTHRQPLELFETIERAALRALPARPYVPVVWKTAKVHRDSHLVFDGGLFSVPWKHVGAVAWVRATPTGVTIYIDDQRVADHPRCGPGQRSTVETHLPDHRRDLRHRGRAWWEERARAIGIETGALVAEIFDDADVLSPLRKVQAIVTHLQTFPRDRAERAAARARHYCVHDYQGVRDILKKALDLEPIPLSLPFATSDGDADAPRYRFTRPVLDMVDRHIHDRKEVN